MNMTENALLLTAGILEQPNAKTAHGLIRTTSRYNIIGVIDKNSAGKDAGYLLDKVDRNMPVYATLEDFLRDSPRKAKYAIIGVAFPGGKLPVEMAAEVKAAIRAGLSIVSGLHDFLSDMPDMKELAAQHKVELIDIRKPRPKDQLKFWTGEIMQVKCPIIAVLGTDCAMGKRTTATLVTQATKEKGLNAHMIFTGQTGWLQGNKYGFILDSTYNDFISGELENAVVTCYKDTSADIIFMEGQSALSNPSGPCGSEFLLSAQCKAVLLQHAPARIWFNGQENTGIKISLKNELELIRSYGSRVLAITLNTRGLSLAQALEYKRQYEKEFGLPVVLPLEEGVGELVDLAVQYKKAFFPSSVTI